MKEIFIISVLTNNFCKFNVQAAEQWDLSSETVARPRYSPLAEITLFHIKKITNTLKHNSNVITLNKILIYITMYMFIIS